MAIEVNCDKCRKELNAPGALVFGPPEKVVDVSAVSVGLFTSLKFHLCTSCFADLMVWFSLKKKD